MIQNTSNLYSASAGTTPSASLGIAVIFNRPPTVSDLRGISGNYPVGQLWIDQTTQASYQLVKTEVNLGAIEAVWIALGGGTASLSQLSGDTGTALPVGGNINIIGGSGVTTSAAGDNVTISLTGGGEAIDSVLLDSGTSPIVPDGSGQISILATVTAAGTNPLRTVGTGANTASIQVQYASTTASTTTNVAGIASFNSADFTVDANGFVAAIGGGFSRSVDVDASLAPGTDPVLPTASGTITVTAAQVASAGAGAEGIRTFSGAANTWAIQIQRSASTTTSTSSLNGISHYNSADFTVDSDGFVSAIGGGFARSVQVDDSSAPGTDPVIPTASGTITVTASQVASGSAGAEGIQTFSGAANTWAVQIQRSVATTTSTTSLNGIAHFDSSQFSVDANGFVSISTFSPFNYQQITNTDSPYAVPSTGYYVSCDSSAGAISVQLPNTTTNYRMFVVKDRTGSASTHNVTVTTVGGAVLIDGATSLVMNTDYEAVSLIWNGTSYEVY